MRRKGEFSRMHLERDYPFQVAIHPDLAGEISQLRFYPSIAPRTKTMVLRGEHRVVVCFGTEGALRGERRLVPNAVGDKPDLKLRNGPQPGRP